MRTKKTIYEQQQLSFNSEGRICQVNDTESAGRQTGPRKNRPKPKVKIEDRDPVSMLRSTESSAKAVEPFNGSLRVGKNTSSYRVHSYHTKIPPEALETLISYYTDPGDTVLDPFCGSGMTGVAAARTNRNVVLSDLSPAAVHIAKNYVNYCDPTLLNAAVKKVANNLRIIMSDLYQLPDNSGQLRTIEYTVWSDVFLCPQCNAEWCYWDILHDSVGLQEGDFPCKVCSSKINKNRSIWAGERPVQSNLSAPTSKRRIVHTTTPEEIELIEKVDRNRSPYWVPDVEFGPDREMWRASHMAMGIHNVASFYTKRNLLALSALRDEIMKESNTRVRDALLFAFTAILNRASKRYQWNAKRPTNVMTGTLYVSSLRYEWNVWSLFKRKAAEVVRYYASFPEGKGSESGTPVLKASATDLNHVPDSSIDFVILDPPFGSNIFYSDVSLLWEAWLNDLTLTDKEMVVGRKTVCKDFAFYQAMLTRAFNEVRRVMKPGATAVLVFSNSDDKVWNCIQTSIQSSGLQTVSSGVLDKVQRSIKGVQADLGKQSVTRLDLILSLRVRPENDDSTQRLEASGGEVLSVVQEVIQSAGSTGCPTDEVYSHVLRTLLEKNITVEGVSMSLVGELCSQVSSLGSDGVWRILPAKDPAFCKVESPYGCVLDPEIGDLQLIHSRPNTLPLKVSIPEVRNVSGSRNTALYNAHSYHTKVPPEAIVPFIEHFTRPGDLILDPFSGSGMTGVAAAQCGRNTILSDLSVVAAHLAYNHTRTCNPDHLLEVFLSKIYEPLRPQFEFIYSTQHHAGALGYVHYTLWSKILECTFCAARFTLWSVIDQATGRVGATIKCGTCDKIIKRRSLKAVGNTPVLLSYEVLTEKHRKRFERPPTESDIEHISKFSLEQIQGWYPRVPIGPDREMYNLSALHLQQVDEVADLYTARNLKSLSLIWSAVQDVADSRIRHALEFAFTNTAWHGTKMRRFNARGGQRPLTGTLYVPHLSSEVNVLEVMKNKIGQLRKFYREFRPVSNCAPAIRIGSATNLSEIPNESVDYVFTDPPFGSNIFYADCNLVFESWLGAVTDPTKEAVVNRTISTQRGGKTVVEYRELMRQALCEIYRVLKVEAWVTLVFHNTDPEVWKALQGAAASAGFEIVHAAGLDRKEHSHKGYKGRSEEEKVAHFDVVLSMQKVVAMGHRDTLVPATDTVIGQIIDRVLNGDGIHSESLQWLHSAVLRELVTSGYDLGTVTFEDVRRLRDSRLQKPELAIW